MTTQLVLNQRGSSLSISGGRYRVRSREREFFMPVHEVNSIVLHASTRLSHEVVMMAIEQNTDILFVDRRGFPTGRVWSNRFGSIATIRKHQLTFSQSRAGVEWIRGLLLRKLDNQATVIDLLATLTSSTNQPDREQSMSALARYAQKLRDVPAVTPVNMDTPMNDFGACFATFRGLEGSAGRVYFSQLNSFLPDAYRFARRSGRGATDAFNCLLNYAYGMLYGHCESALINAGIDPFVGVMHRDEYNRPVLTYDFIEPFRAWADYVVCHLLVQEIVFDEFFDHENGTLYLNTTGKRVLIQAMNDYLAEIVGLGEPGRESLLRSRGQHIVLEAQQLASTLKKSTTEG